MEMELYGTSRGVGPPHDTNDDDDDDDINGMGIDSSNSRDKGRGSYKCGRVSCCYGVIICAELVENSSVMFVVLLQCGVPKKGHVCPYQPKLKRRPEDPPPELRNAAVQVEMDEVGRCL
jgi:hypothetical protein